MYLLYSTLLAVGFLLMTPAFLLRRQKYAAGFKQRLGNYPDFEHDGRKVIWLHCVSVGETNAARPLVDAIRQHFPNHRLVISTTTQTGQELAQDIFKERADAIVYFPFDFKFAVRRALENFKPSTVLLMETEIWPRFIREAKVTGAKIAIVNGRLSERSVSRYKRIRTFISRVLQDIDLALMQGQNDVTRLISLGMPAAKTVVTGNLKFDVAPTEADSSTTAYLRDRFAIDGSRPLIVAASTHHPEEKWILSAFCSARNDWTEGLRLLLAPRHPERFDSVADLAGRFRDDADCEWRDYCLVRRSAAETEADKEADVIILDSIGELRSVYPLADIVFVGGSLIPHGGQSVIEPAIAGRAIVTGPRTENFAAAVESLRRADAIRQTPTAPDESQISERLYEEFIDLLDHPDKRDRLGRNAAELISLSRGATQRTVEELRKMMEVPGENSEPAPAPKGNRASLRY